MDSKIVYQIGASTLAVTAAHGRWTAVVDGVALDRWFATLADAWTAGVTEALRHEASASSTFVAGADAGRCV
jgi:hypothetical protein